jgi:hypothetical protein
MVCIGERSMIVPELTLVVKDVQGFTTLIYIPNVITITSHGGHGLIIIESADTGTYGFTVGDCKYDLYADREYVLTRADLYDLACELGLCGEEDDTV